MSKNDRRKHEPRHVRLYHTMMDTPAWLDLSGNAVKLLMLLAKYDNGRNNGDIFMSCRKAADEIGVGKKCVIRLFRELEDHGFIEAVDRGHFNVKIATATSWRLTWLPVPNRRAPTNDFRDWKPQGLKHGGQNDTRTGAKMTPLPPESAVAGIKMTPAANAIPPKQYYCAGVNMGPQTVSHRGSEIAGRVEGDETPAGEARGVHLRLVPVEEIVGRLAATTPLADAA